MMSLLFHPSYYAVVHVTSDENGYRFIVLLCLYPVCLLVETRTARMVLDHDKVVGSNLISLSFQISHSSILHTNVIVWCVYITYICACIIHVHQGCMIKQGRRKSVWLQLNRGTGRIFIIIDAISLHVCSTDFCKRSGSSLRCCEHQWCTVSCTTLQTEHLVVSGQLATHPNILI